VRLGEKVNRLRLTAFRIVLGMAAMGLLLLLGGFIEGHAVLKESRPAANDKVAGPDVPIMLKYNVRIDAKLSKLQLLHPDNSTSDLTIDTQSSSDTLNSKATGLKPGAYRIRWQVLAPDGHISRGEVPFTVTGS
jgi:methionine-rich copper-binding protein CopC